MRVPITRPAFSRRDTLKTGLAAMLASQVAPAFVRAAEDAAAAEAIVGEGDYQYRCIHDWGMANLPDGYHYGNASHGVAIDKNGLIYITHYGKPESIFVFDPDAKFVKTLAPQDMLGGHGCGHGIDIRTEGDEQFIYLAPSETALAFRKMSMTGEPIWSRDRAKLHEETGKYPAGAPYRPTNTSFSPDGGFFLGDGYGSNWIHQYDKDGTFLRSIGGGGKADGQFATPHGQWLDDRDGTPKLAVCDRANARLQWFDMEGKHLRTQGGFLFPADIDVQGNLMLVPDLHARVTLLDKDNNVLTHLGGQGDFEPWKKTALAGMRKRRKDWKAGRFVHPHDACFDADGNIFVVEWVNTGRVTKLERIT